ncbi:MAG: T9SS type A sorting domain-containing protein [Flavobacteriales bacterium]|nr:T9SS type A sorting domain-containing protein [Flavobacteriales bacterium]
MCWIQLRDIGDNQKIIGKFNLDNTGFILGVDQGRVYSEVWNPTHYETLDGLMNPTAQHWHHIAMTYERGVAIKAFMNGIEVSSDPVSNAPISSSTNPLIIGVSSWTTMSNFQTFGNIDEIAIYNVALTEAEIKSRIFRSISGSETGLIAGYDFNVTSGTSVPDLSGNGNTANGSATFIGTEWVTSKAPIADDNTEVTLELDAVWNGKSFMDPRFTSTTHGLNLIAFGLDTTDYAVFGHNGGIGITADDIPTNAPAGFMRTQRIWPLTSLGGASMDMVVNIAAACAGGTPLDITQPAANYTLLWRPAGSTVFAAVANGSSFTNGVVTFDDHVPASGAYCIGVGNSAIPIGISEFENSVFVRVEPNPNYGQFFLNFESSEVGLAAVEIMDATGKIVLQKTIRVNGSAVREPIDLGAVAKGIYMVKLTISGTTYDQRVVVQ